jgi:L-proline---[L-prolyl-carrier protein] ligase
MSTTIPPSPAETRTVPPSGTPRSLLLLPAQLPPGQAAGTALAGAEPVTYGQLKERVDALAAALTELRGDDPEPGDRVAVWMDKGPHYVEAILAAIQAGCAYVPLDGGQPAERVARILGDAAPVALLTDSRHWEHLDVAALPPGLRAAVVAGPPPKAQPDGMRTAAPGPKPLDWEDFAERGRDVALRHPAAVRREPQPGDLAAILYTSGSTGVPKGVRITHRNLAAFIGWAREELDVGPGDVFANHASFNFDLSTFDLFTAMSCGAALWIVEDGRTRDVTALARGIREHGVTVWYSVPSALHLLTSSGALTSQLAASLRYVLFAGEVFPIPQLRELAAVLPSSTALYNLYGPTETNVCTYHRVWHADLDRSTPVPIGVPLPGARTRVLDDEGRDVEAPDVIGELVVEGDCVTPGYWGRDAESEAAGHHLGRHATGDLVSREQNGALVYRGRKDRMVKLNGYRVELGEVEAALLRHPAVATAGAVVAGEGTAARLVACWTLAEGAERPGLLRIKQHCARHLPAYMVPKAALLLDELPYSPNGKIDYRRLADIAAASSPGRSS